MALLASVSLIGALALLYGGFKHSYFYGPLLDAISYVSDERVFNEIVAGWAQRDPSGTLVGIHAFGDFVLPVYWASLTDPWLEGINYPPLALAVFEIFALLPHYLGLTIFLVLMALAMAAPMWWASRHWDTATRVLFMVILVVLTGPFLATLDRGNIQGLMPVLLFAMAVLSLRGRWLAVGMVIGFMAALKLYPLVLLMILIGERKWRALVVSLATFAGLTLVFLMLTSQDFVTSLPKVFLNNVSFGGSEFTNFMSYNTSFAGGVAHWANLAGLTAITQWIAANPWLVVLGYLLPVLLLLLWRGVPLVFRLLIGMSLMTSVTPIIYPYAANWALAAVALLVFLSERRDEMDGKATPVPRYLMVLIASLAAVLAPYPFFIPGSMEAGSPAGLLTLVIPVVSLAIPAVALWFALKIRGTTWQST